jgi:VWFA-related protein
MALWAGLSIAAVALVSARTPQQTTAAQTTQQPMFRSGTTIVPVDVRVLDKDGQPITNLTQADFTVFENGVPQQVVLFSAHAFTADPAAAAATRLLARNPSKPPVTDNRRVFLLVLGRGRLEAVSKGMTAASDFVRNALLPQDMVAVLAWNRATTFTTDHRAIAALIDRIATIQDKVDSDLLDNGGGLRARYSSRGLPEPVQTRVDDVFQGIGVTSTRVDDAQSPNAARMAQDKRDAYDALNGSPTLGPTPPMELANGGQDLDAFMTDMTRTNEDVAKLYAGIEYMRAVEGEKHLVFVTASGVGLPRTEDDKDISTRAADARVVIDTVQTGGATGVQTHEHLDATLSSSVTMDKFVGVTLERFAEDTGGTSSLFSYAAKGFDAINTSTKFGYLIGYTPTNTNLDATYRNIQVKVNKSGARLEYRHGYFSTPRPALNGTEVRTYTAVLLTASTGSRNFEMSASVNDITGPPRAIDVKMNVDGGRLGFMNRNGRLSAPLTVVVFTTGATTEQQWHTATIAVPENQGTSLKGGIEFTVRSLVSGIPRHVMVVVYDPVNGAVSRAVARDR